MDSKAEFDTGQLVNVTELMQLTNLGICVTEITWPRVRMTSDNWLCVRHNRRQLFEHINNFDSDDDFINDFELVCKHSHNESDVSALTALNALTSETHSYFMKNMTSGQASPTRTLLAISTDSKIFVLHTTKRKCVAWTRFPCEVIYWTWISSNVIAVVGPNDVHHWNIKEDNFVLFFARDIRLKDFHITAYKADQNVHPRWFALTGLSLEKGEAIVGLAQIYSIDYAHWNIIEAHAVDFVSSYRFSNSAVDSSVLVTVKKTSAKQAKLAVIELGPAILSPNQLVSRIEVMNWSDAVQDRYDFPVGLVCSAQLGLIYIFSKYGSLYVYDLETACCVLGKFRVCHDILFSFALDQETQGVVTVARNGQVLLIDLEMNQLIEHINNVGKKPLAKRLRDITNVSFCDQVTKL